MSESVVGAVGRAPRLRPADRSGCEVILVVRVRHDEVLRLARPGRGASTAMVNDNSYGNSLQIDLQDCHSFAAGLFHSRDSGGFKLLTLRICHPQVRLVTLEASGTLVASFSGRASPTSLHQHQRRPCSCGHLSDDRSSRRNVEPISADAADVKLDGLGN
jgi:hypothetical protein